MNPKTKREEVTRSKKYYAVLLGVLQCLCGLTLNKPYF